jgi:outer membrane biosynthesis protein TonB
VIHFGQCQCHAPLCPIEPPEKTEGFHPLLLGNLMINNAIDCILVITITSSQHAPFMPPQRDGQNPMKRFALFALCVLSLPLADANPLKREPDDRARRDADNPLRVIIEAAKVKRSSRPADATEPTPSAPASRTKTQAGQPNPSPTITVITAPAKAKPVPVPTSQPAGEATKTLAAPTEVTGASTPISPEKSASQQPPSPTAATSNEKPPSQLRLLSRVDPVLPEKLQAQIQQDTEVPVKLDIDPQGAVYRVEVLSKTIVGLEPLIQNALRRWRFEPMADRATATVILVFRAEE